MGIQRFRMVSMATIWCASQRDIQNMCVCNVRVVWASRAKDECLDKRKNMYSIYHHSTAIISQFLRIFSVIFWWFFCSLPMSVALSAFSFIQRSFHCSLLCRVLENPPKILSPTVDVFTLSVHFFWLSLIFRSYSYWVFLLPLNPSDVWFLNQ